MPVRSLVIAALLLLALAPAAAHAQSLALEPTAETFQSRLVEDPPRPPPLAARGVRRSLSERPRLQVPAEAAVQWYRWRLGRLTSHELHALYIIQANANAVVYINAAWIGQGGRFLEPAAHTWYRPLYYRFDAASFGRDENVLDVGLLVNGSIFNTLSPPLLAPDRLLRARYERAYALRIPPAEASTVLGLAVMLLFGGLAFALRQSTYAALAVSGGCYAVASLNYHCLQPVVSTWYFNTITNLCLQWAGFSLALLGFLWANPRRPRMVPFTACLVALSGLAAACLPARTYERTMFVGFAATGAMALAGFAAIWRARRALPASEWTVYFGTAVLLVPIALRDIALQLHHQSPDAPMDDLFLVSYFGPLMLLGAGASLLVRFVGVYRRAQNANRHLEAEVARKSAELTLHHESLRQVESRRVLLEERERIMREMHDGVGGHLVAALSLIDHDHGTSPELQQAVRDALDDVRMVVNALDSSSGELSLLLAEMRRQLEPRLRARGVRFRWEVAERTTTRTLGPFEFLQVRRILQEAVTNALKHASASVIRVSSGSVASEVTGYQVEISDDGTGFGASARRGRGIANMLQRAARIGAQLTIDSGEGGTRIRLVLPDSDA